MSDQAYDGFKWFVLLIVSIVVFVIIGHGIDKYYQLRVMELQQPAVQDSSRQDTAVQEVP